MDITDVLNLNGEENDDGSGLDSTPKFSCECIFGFTGERCEKLVPCKDSGVLFGTLGFKGFTQRSLTPDQENTFKTAVQKTSNAFLVASGAEFTVACTYLTYGSTLVNLVVHGKHKDGALKAASEAFNAAVNAKLLHIKKWSTFPKSTAGSFVSNYLQTHSTAPLSLLTTPTPQASTCKDTSNSWKDVYGATCKTYVESAWCTPTGLQGPGWIQKWGNFADFQINGVHAGEVCCGCGGGITATTLHSRNDSAPLTQCLAACAATVKPICMNGVTTLTNPCWADCMGHSLTFTPGACPAVTTPAPVSTSVAKTETTFNEWKCIQSCDGSDKETVCSNGIQFTNACWARCLRIKTFERCNNVVLAAPGSTLAHVTSSTAGIGCCRTEPTSFDASKMWVSKNTCGDAHQVAHSCGGGKQGQITRTCSSTGKWQQESSVLCSNNKIASISVSVTNQAVLPTSYAENLLAQLLAEVIKGYHSLGINDLAAITQVFEYMLKKKVVFNDKFVQLALDITGQLLKSLARTVMIRTYEQMPNLRRLPSVLSDISLAFARSNTTFDRSSVYTLMGLGGQIWQRITRYNTQSNTGALTFATPQQNGSGFIEIRPEALKSQAQGSVFVTMSYYADDSYFAKQGDTRAPSNVMSVFIHPATGKATVSKDFAVTYELSPVNAGSSPRTCVAWRHQSRSPSETWSSEDCRVIKYVDGSTRCHCKHQGFYSLGRTVRPVCFHCCVH